MNDTIKGELEKFIAELRKMSKVEGGYELFKNNIKTMNELLMSAKDVDEAIKRIEALASNY
jgi:hypothetical protein